MKPCMAVLALAVICLQAACCIRAYAQEIPPPPPPCGERPNLTEMTLTGKVTQTSIPCPDGTNTMARYILTDTAGNTVMLPGKPMGPGPRGPEAGGPGPGPGNEPSISVNWEDYVNKMVTIVGKGFQMDRDDKTVIHLVCVTKINTVTAISTDQ